ncbi:ferredoxin [Rhodococcus sp. ACS1]|uniref:2Fe-2S iron-sulfur cluster-binding protein n=1 Tax=unclassified Rhodococcus (in: high G+C Gram-positive bacteria) TaxID=192944 RepID=UPI0009EEC6B6|nr:MULTISPECIES: 2Fe-2S iron-sulfur cluster-binding protein [unclassified Rhodococcus (in: high G+C Gram-positive bacteria)]PBC35304.1 ferredoxin [Rhodococcus sp. ACS1]
MAKATFISPDGKRDELTIDSGTTLMQAAISHGIRSIVGDCGGSGACATCHVYVDPQFLDKLTPMNPNEREMLECASSPVEENSRLSCQIAMQEHLDGINVEIAPTQW